MKTNILLLIFIASMLLFTGCGERYILENKNESIGVNGDFEEIKNGYPLNWDIHASPINKGHSKIILDTVDVQNGTYSLKIEAIKVAGGKKAWKKPGLSKELNIEPNKKYKLSIWIKNTDSKFYVKWTTLDKANKKQLSSKTFIEMDVTVTTWYYFKEIITTNANEEILKLEIVVTQPGTLLVDNIKFEEIIEGD
ncbi:carbohydrate binding domain-containing protein [Bacteroidota bacterium]